MTPHTPLPLDFYPGTAFLKRWVWPGYHWFTFGTHVRALERNGFDVHRAVNLSPHYAKTTAALRLYLAGTSGNFRNKDIHVYRLHCEAV
jgi:cyclopropane fatty-acyl-phospholipid synthase-like methyltransferase